MAVACEGLAHPAGSPSTGIVLVLKDVTVDVEKEGIGDSKANCLPLSEALQHLECVAYPEGVILMEAIDSVGDGLCILEPLEGGLP